jgi:hypothetical protein
VGARFLDAVEIGTTGHRHFHRHQQRALDRVQHRRNDGAQRLGDVEPRVGHHQEEGERREEHQARQRRRPLLEEGRRGPIQGAERHVGTLLALRAKVSGHGGADTLRV